MLSKTEKWMTLLAEEVSLIGPLAQVTGKENFIAVNKPFFESIRGSEIYEIVEYNNYIITQISTDVAVPSGKVITLNVNEWYEIENGMIQSLKVYFDTAEFLNEMNIG
jgi:limonene-1,2-epoxide hydrolase